MTQIRTDKGPILGDRERINFASGSGITITAADDGAVGDEATVTITGGVKLLQGDSFKLQARGSAFACGVDDIDNVGWYLTTQFFWGANNDGSNGVGFPGTSIGTKIVRFGNYVYADGIAGGVVNIYRSLAPSQGGVSWSASLLATAATGAIGTSLNKSTWATGTNYLFYGEYGDPAGGPSIWRSPDGTTWTKVLGPISGLRHIHCVAADPYNPGHVYASAGDGNSKVLYRSTDSGSTWTLLVIDNTFQCVQISFSPDWVFLALDNHQGSVAALDRNNPTVPFLASTSFHWHHAVPGGIGARGPFADGNTTASSATFTSATAAFTAQDVGKFIRFTGTPPFGATAFSDGIYITAFTNATTVTLSKSAGGVRTTEPFYVDGETFVRGSFYGAVDPATGIYYCLANDNTGGGVRYGLFYLPQVGGPLQLLETYPSGTTGELFLRGGKLWAHQASHPLLTKL